jgi:hypothetical protein
MTKNRTRRFLGSLLSAAALVSLAPVADIALAPAAHAASVWNVAEAPYVHSDILGRRWIYGAGHVTGGGVNQQIKATLFQYYGGAWHAVSSNYTTGTSYTLRTIASVYCGSPYSTYSFFTRAQSWSQWPDGWHYDGYNDSRLVTLGC